MLLNSLNHDPPSAAMLDLGFYLGRLALNSKFPNTQRWTTGICYRPGPGSIYMQTASLLNHIFPLSYFYNLYCIKIKVCVRYLFICRWYRIALPGWNRFNWLLRGFYLLVPLFKHIISHIVVSIQQTHLFLLDLHKINAVIIFLLLLLIAHTSFKPFSYTIRFQVHRVLDWEMLRTIWALLIHERE